VQLWKDNDKHATSTDTAILKADEIGNNKDTSIAQIGVDNPFCDRLINGVVFSFFSWCGVRLSALGTSATNVTIVPATDDKCR
jgi:hypothetical protein